MTLHEELITKACLNSTDFGTVTAETLEVRHSNRAYDYLRKRLPFRIFDNLSAVKRNGAMFMVVPNNI